jgi:hypothetical protein
MFPISLTLFKASWYFKIKFRKRWIDYWKIIVVYRILGSFITVQGTLVQGTTEMKD